ncbi:MAG: glycerophosphoryl diester phosphodiesterase [Alphaproteobacteria bacterium]|nr:glycerophosphoryl diester phosphodiesterase [Alphaproteobacteria bacterium]MDE2336385.1 glycerophosphoryl diester phosphodiesterase [Alphaproteobacteria bacterium]
MSKLIIPKIIGHRGACAYAPENTLASIHAAADLGVEWVEMDVKLTRDHIPIIFHDEELDRCTSGSGRVADTDFRDIRELDAGAWFGESFMGEKIPTLEEALNAVIDRGLGLNLEIKPCPGREVETAEIALDFATRIWPDDAPPPLVSSFSHVSLESAMDVMEEWPRGLLIDEYFEQWREIARHLDAHTVNIDGLKLVPEQLEDYLAFGKPVLAYTINDPAKALELFGLGIAGVFSDCPDVIREEIETTH